MNFKKSKPKPPVKPAAGPLAGTPYDFRTLFPGRDKPVKTVGPQAPQGDEVASTRRAFFHWRKPGKGKP